MAVLFLASSLPRFEGDMQAPFVLEQAQQWRARTGEKTIILAPHHEGAAKLEVIGGVEIRRHQYTFSATRQTLAYPAILPNLRNNPSRALQVPGFLASQTRAAVKIVAEENIRFIYAHWVMPQGLVAWAVSNFCGVPYALQNHSSDLAVFERAGPAGRSLARRIIGRSMAFFCVNSDQLKAAVDLVGPSGADALLTKSTVLPMGVSLEEAKQADGEFDYDIAMISRLSAKKGVDQFISSVSGLSIHGRPLHAAVAGDGELAPSLRALDVDGQVAFPGFLTGSAKWAFFNASPAFAFPSMKTGGDVEGMPVAMLEALCLGKQIIASPATNIRLLPEWPRIKDLVTIVENPKDTTAFRSAILDVVSLNEDERRRRGDVLRDIFSVYKWENLIERYLEVIDQRFERENRSDRSVKSA